MHYNQAESLNVVRGFFSLSRYRPNIQIKRIKVLSPNNLGNFRAVKHYLCRTCCTN